MKNFNELWKFISDRSNRDVKPIVLVQDKTELEHIFNLMRNCECKSYLEVGTAEGNSLYVLAQSMKSHSDIAIIDLGEPHTTKPREDVLNILKDECLYVKDKIYGDSTLPSTIGRLCLGKPERKFDCILIDGGHDFSTVLSDAIFYAPLATKYIFFHDIQLPEVRRAVSWWHSRWQLGKYSEFINSDNFGYAIIEVGKYE